MRNGNYDTQPAIVCHGRLQFVSDGRNGASMTSKPLCRVVALADLQMHLDFVDHQTSTAETITPQFAFSNAQELNCWSGCSLQQPIQCLFWFNAVPHKIPIHIAVQILLCRPLERSQEVLQAGMQCSDVLDVKALPNLTSAEFGAQHKMSNP